jgi:hypothetical protein
MTGRARADLESARPHARGLGPGSDPGLRAWGRDEAHLLGEQLI